MSRLALAVLPFLVLLAAQAGAAAPRVFVATFGADANATVSCSAALPCRTFAAAVGAASPGGEVVVLDSGGYGPVTLTQSVTLAAPPGVYAGVTVQRLAGTSIATPGIEVVLRGLTFVGDGGPYGVQMSDGASLDIERCTFCGFGPNTISFRQAVAIEVTTGANVAITDTVVARNSVGIRVGGGASAQMTRVRAFDDIYGVMIASNSNTTTTFMSVTDSVASSNLVAGFIVLGQNSG